MSRILKTGIISIVAFGATSCQKLANTKLVAKSHDITKNFNIDTFSSKATKKAYFIDTLDLQRYKNIELNTKKRLIRTCIKF